MEILNISIAVVKQFMNGLSFYIGIEVDIIYQSIEQLHQACPNNNGDWYFSGNYPTPGGNRVINKAFINYMENKDERAY